MNLSLHLKSICITCMFFCSTIMTNAQSTLLLRQPSLHANQIAFTYGADVWMADKNGQNVRRITSTQAVESNPMISPDGRHVAFTSNRGGNAAVYIVSTQGGIPKRLTWMPGGASVRDWSPDGSHILFASAYGTAPSSHNYLWKVDKNGGPEIKVSKQWGNDASYAPDGHRLIVDRMRRWDSEWRLYRGGQNTPLIILDTRDNSEVLIPCEKTTDIQPLWLGDMVYFISDRDGTANIWSYNTNDKALSQITTFTGTDVKTLSGYGDELAFERAGSLHLLDLTSNAITTLDITIIGDFPWAEEKWEDVSSRARSASLSPTGKRVLMESRGDIFTVPAKDGAARNITKSSGTADRRPIWSPKGDQIAWFSDKGNSNYKLYFTDQSGLKETTSIDIGESKLGWDLTWSPDGERIAFVDDDTRVKVLTLKDKTWKTIDHAGTNLDRGNMSLTWSPDSKWLAYAKSGSNNLRRIMVWNVGTESPVRLTDEFADATLPAWDRDGKHFYFVASTDVALGSGWANTSAMQADPEYAAYVINLVKDDKSPFVPKSDEEEVKKEEPEEKDEAAEKENKKDKKKKKEKKEKKDEDADKKDKDKDELKVVIDFDNIVRRTIALPLPEAYYSTVIAGPKGSVFFGSFNRGSRGLNVKKFSLKDREAKDYVSGASNLSISNDGKSLLGRIQGKWQIMNAAGPSGKDGKSVKVNLKMKLNRVDEWTQIAEEAWRYQRDYFYDQNMHGRDWNLVRERYAPLYPFIRHRSDLTYILDQMNGELSVGHSFVFGGDFPEVERSTLGLLGADFVADQGRWKITNILTTEAWNPGLSGPLDRPGTKIKEGYYLVGINGIELTTDDNLYEHLDGTAGIQTIVHINDKPDFESSWQEVVEPVRSDIGLRRRAWVEDNRRMVDSLSGGKLAYIWVPNTGGGGFVSFNRYFFAQQDKLGAVIDERFNGGGLLDDYMVDLMTRKLRAGLTNEVPDGVAMKLPAGILGPKVLLINELAGSGGDFFPWVFRQQKAGKLIGATTWGGLVKSSVHYGFIDGGAMTAPDNAVFDPINDEWIGENKGIHPDIEVRQDAASLEAGRDPQLERAVTELLNQLGNKSSNQITPPKYSEPSKGN